MRITLTLRRILGISAIGLGCALVILSMATLVAADGGGEPTVDGLLDESYTFLKRFEKSGSGDEMLAPGNLWGYEGTDTCYWAFVVDRAFNDNVFADSDSDYLALDGWVGGHGHRFHALKQSDGAQFVLTGGSGYTVWLDYLNYSNGQYKSGQHNDGWNSSVDAPISAVATSLYYNMTQSGWTDQTHSPPYDYNDTPGQYWEWQMIYEFAVSKSDLGGTCGDVTQGGAHNSPYKDKGLASIGDYVWHDVNLNGIQDPGETGIANVTVKLYDSTDTLIRWTQTAPSGYYIFNNLEAGDYYVEFVPPEDYDFSRQDQGTDDTIDSDADPTTGKTGTINLSAGETDLTWDAGLHLCVIGDRVWNDEDGQGNQSNVVPGYEEPGFNGVDLYLYNYQPSTCGENGYLAMTTTASGISQDPDGWPDGIYYFDMGDLGLPTGDYWVCVDENSLPNPGQGMHWTSTTGGNTQQVNYTAGTDDFSFDFGYVAESDPTAVTLSSFAAKPNAGGAVSPLWLGVAGVTVLVAGSLFWKKRRAG